MRAISNPIVTKIKTKWYIGLLGVLAIGIIRGFAAGVFTERRHTEQSQEEGMHGLILSHAALQTTQFTMLLKACREGTQDLAIDRLQTKFDFALIDVATEYFRRNYLEQAVKALHLAADYRKAYPHSNSLDSVAIQVEGALSLASKAPVEP